MNILLKLELFVVFMFIAIASVYIAMVDIAPGYTGSISAWNWVEFWFIKIGAAFVSCAAFLYALSVFNPKILDNSS